MDIDTFKPTFLIQIEGQTLSADITQEITSFVFEDNEEELDVLELAVTDRNLQFVDDPLFQEGNEIIARFGYVGNLSPRKKAVIKDIDYDFPEDGDPTIRITAYDKGFKLAGELGRPDAARWIEAHPKEYAEGVFRGFIVDPQGDKS